MSSPLTMLPTIARGSESPGCDDARLTGVMVMLGGLSRSNSFGSITQLLNSDIDPYGVVRAGIVGLQSSYSEGWSTDMWFFQWCSNLTSLADVPTGLLRLYIRLFIENMILPRVVIDKCFALDALAPVLYVCNLVGASCDVIPIDVVHSHISDVCGTTTFTLMNNYIVSKGNPESIAVYISYIITGAAHTACADVMIENGMVHAIDEGETLVQLIDGWLSTERDGLMRILRHVISHSVYMAVMARDHLMSTPHRTTSRAMGELMGVVTAAVPYMTFDFTNMDTSDPSWTRVLARMSKLTTVGELPWPVPVALHPL